MICAISGEVPEEPVLSRNSGILFERRLIERHIADYGKCPVTKDDLAMDDIIPVKTSKAVKPRPLQAASIPGLLGVFQNEWDALMLSNFALEQQLHTARQELSNALYQVTSVKFVPRDDLFVTGSGDKTVRVWQGNEDGSYDCRHVLKDHTAEVQAVTIHATNKYFVTASMDNTWCFYDLTTGSCLTQVRKATLQLLFIPMVLSLEPEHLNHLSEFGM